MTVDESAFRKQLGEAILAVAWHVFILPFEFIDTPAGLIHGKGPRYIGHQFFISIRSLLGEQRYILQIAFLVSIGGGQESKLNTCPLGL